MTEKSAEMQLRELEQNLQSFAVQKQNMQIQLAEVENSLKELEACKEKAYKVIGPIMVELTKEELAKDLNGKKEMLAFRIESLEKKEKALKESFNNLQKDIVENLKK